MKRSEKLKPEEKEVLDIMLLYSEDLRQAYKLKDQHLKYVKTVKEQGFKESPPQLLT